MSYLKHSKSIFTARRTLRPLSLTLMLAALFGLASGCGDDESSSSNNVCGAGDTRECLGPGACQGAQECLPDGSGFTPCDCASATDGGADNAGGSSVAGPGDGGTGNATSGGAGTGGTGNVEPGASGAGGAPTGQAGAAGSGDGGAGGAPSPACHPVGNTGCQANQNCTVDASDGPQCVTSGSKAVGAACTSAGDCAGGLTCLPTLGVCAKACTNDQGCDGSAGSCRFLVDRSAFGLGVFGGCLKACDVLAQGCPGQQACHLGSCVEGGGTVAQGATCDFLSQCAKGTDCLADLTGDGKTDCSKYCAVSAQAPCGTGMVCYALSESLSGAPAEWGTCIKEQ